MVLNEKEECNMVDVLGFYCCYHCSFEVVAKVRPAFLLYSIWTVISLSQILATCICIQKEAEASFAGGLAFGEAVRKDESLLRLTSPNLLTSSFANAVI